MNELGALVASHIPALVMLIVGYALLVVEMYVPGFGLPGISGIVLLTDYARALCEEAGAEALAWCTGLSGRVLALAAAWPLLEEIGQRIGSLLG